MADPTLEQTLAEIEGLDDAAKNLAKSIAAAFGTDTKAVEKFRKGIQNAGKDIQEQARVFEAAAARINIFKPNIVAEMGINVKKYGNDLEELATSYKGVSDALTAAAKAAADAGGPDAEKSKNIVKEYESYLENITKRYVQIGGNVTEISKLGTVINVDAKKNKELLEDQLETIKDQGDEYAANIKKQEELKTKAAGLREAAKIDWSEAMGLDPIKADMVDVLKKNTELIKQGGVLKGSMSAVGNTLKGIGGILKNNAKLLAGIGIISGVVALAWWGISKIFSGIGSRAKEIDTATEDFRKNTGLTRDQMQETTQVATELSRELTSMGVNLGTALDASSKIVQEFGVAVPLLKDTVSTVSLLNANFGITSEESAKILRNFTGVSGLTEQSAANVMKLGSFLASKAGVPTKMVFQDIAAAADDTYMFLSQSPMQMMKMAVEARRLGTTLASITKSGRGMLNFQESIQSELQLSALLGKSVNAQYVRQLVYENDLIGARKESIRQIKNLGDLNKMNFYQREAIVKLYGIEWNEINKMIAQEKALDKIKDKARAGDKKAQKLLDDYTRALATRKLEEDDAALAAADREIKSTARMGRLNQISANFQSTLLRITGLADSAYDSVLGFAAGASGVLADTPEQAKTSTEELGQTVVKASGEAIKAQAQMGNAVNLTNKIIFKSGEISKKLFSENAAVRWKQTTEMFSAMFAKVSTGDGIFSRISRKVAGYIDAIKTGIKPVTDAFVNFYKSTGIFGRMFSGVAGLVKSTLGVLFSGFKKIAAPLFIIKDTWEKITETFKNGDNWDFSDFLMKSLKVLAEMPMIIYDNTIGAFANLGDIAIEFFGGPKGFLKQFAKMVPDGFKMMGDALGDFIVWGMDNFPKLWSSMIDGLSDAVLAIPQIIGNAFNSAKEKIKGWLGFSPSELGLSIVKGISSVGDVITNFLVSPFKKAWDWIKEKVPFAKTLFGGSSSETTVKVYSGESNESLNKLNEAVLRLNQAPTAPTPIVNVGDNNAAMVAKLDELISLLRGGAIGVNIDGIMVSKALATKS